MEKRERRIFDRFKVDFAAEIRKPGAIQTSYAQSCDVSAIGMGLFTQEQLMPQAKMELWLGIPNGHPPFQGLARVVWSKQVQENKWRSGLEFEKVDFMGVRRIFSAVGKPA